MVEPHKLVFVFDLYYFCRLFKNPFKMFIKKIKKKNKGSDKVYISYRLVHTYKVGKKVRQQNIINLGKLEGVPLDSFKLLANRIEEILTGTMSMFSNLSKELDEKAQYFADEIIKKGVFPVINKKRVVSQELSEDYQEVDINSMDQTESRSLGGEWLVKQAFDEFELGGLFKEIEMTDKESAVAQELLTAKLIHPSSELESERWIKENSGVTELYSTGDHHSVTRYRLYQAATQMYNHKEKIEDYIYSKTYSMFSGRSNIVIYDLTNMYFEGQMKRSKNAKFGRSKEKRYDCRLMGLALAIDSLGFVRYSKIYQGNIGEPDTFGKMIKDVVKQFSKEQETPMVIMDAGIAVDDNLKILKGLKYDYVCVSRSTPVDYTKQSENATQLKDNRGHKIEVTKIWDKEKEETFLQIKSEQKQLKESAMDEKITQRFEESLKYLKEGLTIPRRLKKIVPVHEKIGRLKDRNSKVAKLYKITYKEDNEKGVVTDIAWERQQEKRKHKGEYFLRYSKEVLSDEQIWDMYNLTREVESCFRFLKTDLNIRPIHHQEDKYIESHIWLGIVAYQIGRFIRLKLKEHGINYSWKTIVEKMISEQVSIISIDTKEQGKIYTKLITRPSVDQQAIYNALGFKHRPFTRKTKVVTHL